MSRASRGYLSRFVKSGSGSRGELRRVCLGDVWPVQAVVDGFACRVLLRRVLSVYGSLVVFGRVWPAWLGLPVGFSLVS